MRIHSPHAHKRDKIRRSDFFYNYFTLGLVRISFYQIKYDFFCFYELNLYIIKYDLICTKLSTLFIEVTDYTSYI